MSVEGLWTIQFSETEEFYDNIQVGEELNLGGVFVLTNNKVFGGGISFYYTGTYEATKATISLKIKSKRYNDLVPGAFGQTNEAAFTFSGTVNDDKMKLHGFLDDDKNKMAFIHASKRADI
jgi:hypothetical protein